MFPTILPIVSIVSILKGEVYYERLGSFSTTSPWSGTLQRPIAFFPWPPELINTRFLLYTRDNPNTFQEISAVKRNTITALNFKTIRKTRFIIHGFIDSGEKKWLSDMCKAMLRVEDVNCICVDWAGGSQTFYTQATNNIRVVGAEVAYFITILQDKFGYSPSNIHLIGHSLGAHAAGEAGKRKPGIGRITGLDPAQPYFQDTPPEVRLDPSDADFVDVIHTDSYHPAFVGLGISHPVGHFDFYPNGGNRMPGCVPPDVLLSGNLDNILSGNLDDAFAAFASCSHLRSYQYYTESIQLPGGFMAYPSPSYQDFLEGAMFPCATGGQCPVMGHYADKHSLNISAGQVFYLNTGAEPSYSRWRYRVMVHTVGNEEVLGSIAVSLGGFSRNHLVYRGLMKPDIAYAVLIDAEVSAGNIHNITVTCSDCHLKLSVSSVTVQDGADGSVYSFCNSKREHSLDSSPSSPTSLFLPC
ncbi:pancreatic lipase-related protein 2-like isoform X2 [Hyperolius riggenbachi]